jgi:SAM-dependent methyltransferase
MEAGQVFDAVAALYDAQRSGYPEQLFKDIQTIAGLGPSSRILEVGCGSGQATAGFLALGLDVTAIDPGSALVDIAREKFATAPNIKFAVTTFEEWPLVKSGFELIAAGQSWHWVKPDVGLEKAAAALVAQGHFAVFSHTPSWSTELIELLKPIYLRFAPEIWGRPVEAWYLPQGPIPTLLLEGGWFDPPAHRSYRWRRAYAAASFADYLGTRSDHLRLDKGRRETLLSKVASTLPANITADWVTNLYVAQKKQ